MPEIFAVTERTPPKYSQGPRGDEVLQPAVVEGITPNLFETVWQPNISDFVAVIERPFPDNL